jgi:hypothetical protein
VDPINAPTKASAPVTFVVAGPPRAPQQSARVEVREPAGRAHLETTVTRRSDGVQQVAIVDPISGDEVFKTPSDAALQVIDAAIEMIEARKEIGR